MRRGGSIRGWGIALACGAFLLCTAQPAAASRVVMSYTLDYLGYELQYIADPGESNAVTHRAEGGSPGDAERITITDTGATIETQPGDPCTSHGPHEVTCVPDPVAEAYPFANGLANCASRQQPTRPDVEDCDTDFANQGFGMIRLALDDGDNSYRSTPGSVPLLHLTVYALGGGANNFEVSGEQSASLGGSEGDDRLVVGPLVQAGPGTGRASVTGFGGADRINVRNGLVGDSVRCGAGVDPEPKVDNGDVLLQNHQCEEVPEGAELDP
jgi:hypothetical protein